MKELYKGVFNISGQNIVIYRHAHSGIQAKRLLLHGISHEYNMPLQRLISIFGGSKDNYLITKEEQR